MRLVPEGTPVCFDYKHSEDYILIYVFMFLLHIYIYINRCCALAIKVISQSFLTSICFQYPDSL